MWEDLRAGYEVKQRDLLGYSWATFSLDMVYRYVLYRRIEPRDDLRPDHRVVWIMLNPSTADGLEDDPTIRRVAGFSRTLDATEVVVVNLFALRSTDPANLARHADPIGPRNDEAIRDAVDGAAFVIGAWGAHPAARARWSTVLQLLPRPVMCLGTTQSGQPRHPLYVRKDQPLTPWRGKEAARSGPAEAPKIT